MMPKNRPKTKKVVKKRKETRKSAKPKSVTKAQAVKDTYQEWISRQVKNSKSRGNSRPQPARENPLDTFNEWMKKQKVRGTASEQKAAELPKDTYELWMARQIRERGDEPDGAEERVESSGSTQLLSVPRKEKEELSKLVKLREVTITVKGRKSGKTFTTPVWFVYDDESREFSLMPVRGSDSNWFKNLKVNPELGLSFGGKDYTVNAMTKVDAREAEEIADRFRTKYGEEDVKNYYPKIDSYVRFTLE